MVYTQYPDNSKANQTVQTAPADNTTQTRTTLQPVAKGSLKKPSFARRTVDEIFPSSNDGKTIGEHIWFDAAIPFFKSMAMDMLGRLFYGDNVRSSFTGAMQAGGRVAYGQISTSLRQSSIPLVPNNQQQIQQAINLATNVGDIIFITDEDGTGHQKAEMVLKNMIDILRAYQRVTVLDFYELSGCTPGPSTNFNFGWTDLSNATVIDNFFNGTARLSLPPAQSLK